MLRVTGGKFRGISLHCPPNIRPTSGRVKEYIFSQIAEFIPRTRVLDIFAGSGALGIEALSRNAREAVFIDKSQKSFITIKKNLQKIDYQASVLKNDAIVYLKRFKEEPFDIIFIDPPYREYEPSTILSLIEKKDLLPKGGHLVFELSAGTPEPVTNVLLPNSYRTLGDTTIGIWFRPI